jgi:A/G-specific adenine glycosylase
VGDYTASAICSIAYGLPYAVVDGNVYRVLSRLYGVDTPIDSSAGKKEFALLAKAMLGNHEPGEYNQAIMDFGALQCIPKGVDCHACPLQETCVAFHEQSVQFLPRKERNVKIRKRYFTYIYIRNSHNEVLIEQRTEKDIWHHLYQLPLIESDHPLSHIDVAEMFPQSEVFFCVSPIVHQLTHQRIIAQCVKIESAPDSFLKNRQWVSIASLHEYVFPQLLLRILDKILE